jgi:hypothetical protein
MRSIYLILGFVLGVLLTARYSTVVVENLIDNQRDELLMGQLMAFNEGYVKGRIAATKKSLWAVIDCYDQLQFSREYIKYLESTKGKEGAGL